MNARILAALQTAVRLYETMGLVAHAGECGPWINEARDAIAEVTPKPLRVGDTVRLRGVGGHTLEIRAFDDKAALVKWVGGDGKYSARQLIDLERVS